MSPKKSSPLPLVGTQTLPLPCKTEQPRAELGNQEPKILKKENLGMRCRGLLKSL